MSDAELEAEGLWAEIFGEPPSISAPLGLLIRILVEALPPAPPYAPAASNVPPGYAADDGQCAPVYPIRRAG